MSPFTPWAGSGICVKKSRSTAIGLCPPLYTPRHLTLRAGDGRNPIARERLFISQAQNTGAPANIRTRGCRGGAATAPRLQSRRLFFLQTPESAVGPGGFKQTPESAVGPPGCPRGGDPPVSIGTAPSMGLRIAVAPLENKKTAAAARGAAARSSHAQCALIARSLHAYSTHHCTLTKYKGFQELRET